MAPREGLEPPTNRLTADRSTTELPRNKVRPYPGEGRLPEGGILGGSRPGVKWPLLRLYYPATMKGGGALKILCSRCIM